MAGVTRAIGGLFGGGPKRNESLDREIRRQQIEEQAEAGRLTAKDEERRIRAQRGGRLRALAYQGGKPAALGTAG